MAIQNTDIKFKAPERLDDTAQGGGAMTGTEIISGEINNLFPDISRLDRVNGRVSLRKGFAHVASDNQDQYLGAHVIITDPPDDPYVTVSMLAADAQGRRGAAAEKVNAAESRLYSTVTLSEAIQGSVTPKQSCRVARLRIPALPSSTLALPVSYDPLIGLVSSIAEQSPAVVITGNDISWSAGGTLNLTENGTGAHIYPIVPGTFSAIRAGSNMAISDDGLGSLVGLQGTIDYQAGRITLPPEYGIQQLDQVTFHHGINFVGPLASAVSMPADGFAKNFTLTLPALPAPGTVQGAYWAGEVLRRFTSGPSGQLKLDDGGSGFVDGTTVVLYALYAPQAGTRVVVHYQPPASHPLPASIHAYLPHTGILPETLTLAVQDDQLAWHNATFDATGAASAGTLTGTFDAETSYFTLTDSANTLKTETLSLTADRLTPHVADIEGFNTSLANEDGQLPCFVPGDVIVVHHTATDAVPGGQVEGGTYQVSRTDLASISVAASDGNTLPKSAYSVDLAAGLVTWGTIGAYPQPYQLAHTIENMSKVLNASSTLLTLQAPLTHDFPAHETYVSSALILGDLWAYVGVFFAQETWDEVFQNTRAGGDPSFGYNTIDYPLQLTNRGAVSERWALVFTATDTFQIIGEQLGIIGIGYTSNDTAPANPAVNAPYFFLDYRGFGAGWAPGNVLRFDTVGAYAGVWFIRTTSPGPVVEANDAARLAIRGDAS